MRQSARYCRTRSASAARTPAWCSERCHDGGLEGLGPGRRRAGAGFAVMVVSARGTERGAVAQSGLAPSLLATVFCSSSGEGVNCHALCETLATSAPMVSPTRFTNSVHNAAAGCWHIAVASRATSTSVCAFDASFGAGLIEAATSIHAAREPLLLVARDSPHPAP